MTMMELDNSVGVIPKDQATLIPRVFLKRRLRVTKIGDVYGPFKIVMLTSDDPEKRNDNLEEEASTSSSAKVATSRSRPGRAEDKTTPKKRQ